MKKVRGWHSLDAGGGEGSTLWCGRSARTIIGASVGLVLVSAAFAGAAQIASGAPQSVRFTALPKKALAGESVTVAVSGPLSKDVCSLTVRYADGCSRRDSAR